MCEESEEIRALISGYLDGELGPDDRERVERLLKEDEAFRGEYEKMKQLVDVTAEFHIEDPTEEVWETFLDGVYNRVERRTGWLLFVVGTVILAGLGVYWFAFADWGTPLMKIVVAVPVAGLVVLFVSVLRQRLLVARTDRYSREVKW